MYDFGTEDSNSRLDSNSRVCMEMHSRLVKEKATATRYARAIRARQRGFCIFQNCCQRHNATIQKQTGNNGKSQ